MMRFAIVMAGLTMVAVAGWAGEGDDNRNATAAGEVANPSTFSHHLLELSGRKAGICAMPRCGDGKLAVEIAQASKLLVYALSENPAEVTAARKVADAAGLLNRTVYIDEGNAAHNPLADWSADLLVVADVSDADLERLAARDVKRVLAPYRGVAVVGRAKALGAGLDRARLEAWLKKLDVPGGRVIADDAGLWAVATMPPLAGGDDWTHYAHGSDQNRLSADSALKWPYLTQWTAKPYQDGRFDIVVAAGGRLFRANATLAVGGTRTDGIVARSAYNGRVLWTRKTADDFGTFGSLIVATPEVVYVKDGNGVLCLDAETGAERKRIAFGDDAQGECKWLMLQDGILVTVLGSRPQEKSLRGLPYSLPMPTRDKPGSYMPNSPEFFGVHQKWFLDYDLGTALVAVDAASGRELWRQAASRIDPAKTAIAAGRVFFYADCSYAASLDLKTGTTIWKTEAPIAKEPKGSGFSITFQVTERVGALASGQVYMINSYKDGHYQTFAAQDGRILWGEGRGREKPVDEGRLGKLSHPVLVDGRLLTKGTEVINPLTGKPTGEKLPNLNWGNCGPYCVSTHGIHGGGGTAYDRDTKAAITVPSRYMKAACTSSLVAADGALFSGNGGCVGCMEWSGHLVFCSSVALDETAERLRTGKTVNATVRATPLDWPTYRADNTRCGSSAATVPAKAVVRWTWTPKSACDAKDDPLSAPESTTTQALCLGERVVFGTATGDIRCLDRQSGKELWSYATAGRIISAPSFWAGRIYAGSGDGRVYCLDAADGTLVWRYRVAPAERRIMVFGNLMSAWPVSANVLVQPDGKDGAQVFATAGLLGVAGGTTLCALDARSGALRWETRWPTAIAPQASVPFQPSATGQMAWYDGRLWLHVGDSGVLVVDPRTGTAMQAVDFEQLDNRRSLSRDHMRWATYGYVRGQDIGILPGGWVALGGRQFFNTADRVDQPRNTCSFFRAGPEGMTIAAHGYPDMAVLDKLHEGSSLPVWDGQEALLNGVKNKNPVFVRTLGEGLAAAVGAHPFEPARNAKNYWNDGLRNPVGAQLPAGQQRPALTGKMQGRGCVTPVLAGNAIVFLDGQQEWNVVAVGRADSAPLWDIRLPAQPVFGGLSVSAVGDVLVPLVDGRVVCVGGETK